MDLDGWLSSQPIAHRGLYDEPDGRPENSIAAFENALIHNIPFEFDVQLTSDGHAVVLHDANLSRTTGENMLVSNCEWAFIRRLRLKSNGQRIPTLDDVLELVNGSVPIVIDARKWKINLDSRLEQVIADRIAKYHGPIAIQSFDPLAVLRFRKLVRNHPIGQISGALHSARPLMRMIGKTMATNFLNKPDFISYELSQLPSVFVDFWHRRGGPLLAFTAHSDNEERHALSLADNIFFSGYFPKNYRKF